MHNRFDNNITDVAHMSDLTTPCHHSVTLYHAPHL